MSVLVIHLPFRLKSCGLIYAFFLPPFQGLAPTKLRYSSSAGQSPLTVRQPMKAGSSANTLLPPRQPVRATGYASPTGRVRKLPSSTLSPASAGSSSSMAKSSCVATGTKNSLAKTRSSVVGATAPKSKLNQPAKR